MCRAVDLARKYIRWVLTHVLLLIQRSIELRTRAFETFRQIKALERSLQVETAARFERLYSMLNLGLC